MSRLDLVVFGATGFTGKHAVQLLARLASAEGLTWAVAGRSETKLRTVLQEASKKTGEDLSSIKIILAEVTDEKSLKEMCSQAKVLVNCCGPYRLYGEPVVKAAIDSKAHYVDVSGEPQFIDTMHLEYDKAAREAGVFIIPACGFECVSTDLGVVYLQQQFEGTLNSVECYLTAIPPPNAKGCFLHYGTWTSFIHTLAHFNELRALHKLFPEHLPSFRPKLRKRGVHSRFGKWNVPFVSAAAPGVYRTQRKLYETAHTTRPVQFQPYVALGGLLSIVGALFAAAILYVMCMTRCTKKLLLDYPRLFSFGWVSHSGPSEEVMSNCSFRFELLGSGWARGAAYGQAPDKNMVVRVSGMNPAYGATVSALVYSALTILRQRALMPKDGGVMTTGVAFQKTDLIKQLFDKDIKFEVIPQTDK